ncbi:DNA-binding transcriptional regulator, LysR family [Saccharopolyspora kobensis]|uniref:Transcriptional regulator, LysR family n=1 Tax=Saccharopolyspora kobensis TaxID=146035 RepID=A0A1H6DGQ6_9PSEU|nr:LysR family transcriptional regulator [Saccharopolyspora kobensis]SEG83786.1 DNA-binding transcriptional regulator, LysR family [Saccharopolyspora kobensis]SFE33537.1 transcriptional regulator, LysR family [Saccharopolyspora kobensis]
MERRDIEIFLALAEELHFGRAAERLRVSQARVSQSIKAMERRIGAPLFDRTSRRVALTPIGRRLEADVRPAYEQLLAGIERAIAAGRGEEGTLRIAFEAPAMAHLISGVLNDFRSRHPGCEVDVREAPFDDPLATLRSGEADLAVVLLPVTEPDVTTGPVVHTEPMVLAVASGHPFARREFVTLEDLGRDTVLRAAHPPPAYWRDPPEPWTTPAGAPITRGRTCRTFQELLLLIGASEGICPLAAHAAEYFARPGIAFVPFRDAPQAQWGLLWRSAEETALVKAFAATAGAGLPPR